MQLLVFILNQTESLESLMSELTHAGIKGATIIQSKGMARALSHTDDAFLGSLRALLSPGREENHTILMALTDEMVEVAKNVIREVVGDLTKPDSGVIFTLPISSTEGLKI